jgi:hypothetical protein
MLAYAAQGHPRGIEGDHIRDYLKRASAALDGIADAATAAAAARGADADVFRPVVSMLGEDARERGCAARRAVPSTAQRVGTARAPRGAPRP